jgi:hypothetical protein
VTFDTAPALVVTSPEAPVRAPAPPPMFAVIVVASVAWLLGVKDVVVEPDEPVTPVVGETTAVNPAAGAVVTEKVTGTPGCPVVSLAVIVIALPPAKNGVTPGRTLTTVPTATSYATHVGPGYDAGLEPPSIRVVVNVPVGGAAVTGDAVLTETVPSARVSVKPGARLPVKVMAEAVCTETTLR